VIYRELTNKITNSVRAVVGAEPAPIHVGEPQRVRVPQARRRFELSRSLGAARSTHRDGLLLLLL